MSYLDQQRAHQLIEPYVDIIQASLLTAWDDFVSMSKDSPITRKRTRANIVWDRFESIAKAAFADTDVVPIERYESTTFALPNLIFRMKKGDENGKSSNYPTQNALDYRTQESQTDLFGTTPKVDVVYILDDAETSIIDIRIVYWNARRVEWQFSIHSEQMPVSQQQETNTSAPETRPGRGILKAKTANQEQDQEPAGRIKNE